MRLAGAAEGPEPQTLALWNRTIVTFRATVAGNTPAQRAYEGVGFAVVDEKRDPAFEATFGTPGIRRLQRRA